MKWTTSWSVTTGKGMYVVIYTQRSAFQAAATAMATAVNVNVPHYDYDSDSFVFDDGKVISNTDPIFKEYKWF